ncbi:hypothetical protein CHUAL_000922 [Chamberlinius hualienensis]
MMTLKAFSGKLELHLQHCSPPVSAQVCLSVPKLNMSNWCHTFVHGERAPIPKPVLDTHSSDDCFMEAYLNAVNSNSVTFTVSIVCSSLLGKNGNPVTVDLLKNQTIKFPPCPYKKVDSLLLKDNADIQSQPSFPALLAVRQPDSVATEIKELSFKTAVADSQQCGPMSSHCGEGEFCDLQSISSKVGVCQCLPNYSRNSFGFCQLIPTVPSSSDNSSTVAPRADSSQIQTPSQTAISIIVPIVIIIVLSTLVILAYKYRWTLKLRAMFMPSRRYEEMVIDGDEVGNLHSTGSDPVA